MKFLQILLLILSLAILANAQKAILTGTVYDSFGAMIPEAKITAVSEKGEKFEALSNDDGIYVLALPFNAYEGGTNYKVARYEITVVVEGSGFEKFILKDFKFVPSFKGKMNLDVALDLSNSKNCGAGGCPPATDNVETKNTDKVVQKPLVISPKEQNKSKRKNKNNK